MHYYSIKGTDKGLYFGVGFLAAMLMLFSCGVVFASEFFMDKGLISSLLRGNNYLNDTGVRQARLDGKWLGILLIATNALVLFVPSFFYIINGKLNILKWPNKSERKPF